MKKLYTEYLRENNPINYFDVPDLSRDPLTLSLLIDNSNLLDFINTNKKTNIINLYSTFINSKINLADADKTYKDSCTKLVGYTEQFKTKMLNIKKNIKNRLKAGPIPKNEQNIIIQQIIQLKINYIKTIFTVADAIMQIYILQNIYFVSTKELLEGLKEEYGNIIKYYEQPRLAIKCIDNDISMLESLIKRDPENPYSNSYFDNYNNFKEFYENKLYNTNLGRRLRKSSKF
jgi:hypothetical protein